MSLINDALKAAQRERAGRGADVRWPMPSFEGVFPYAILSKAPSPIPPTTKRNLARSSIQPVVPADSAATTPAAAAPTTTTAPSVSSETTAANAASPQVRLVLDPVGTRPADSLARLAHTEHMKNNLGAARDLYEKAIATKQAPADAFNNYGVLLEQQGNRATFEDAVRSSPGDARAHHAYGSFLQTIKDYRGAIREFDLFVENAEKTPGEFEAEKVTEMRRHIATLRRAAP